MHLLPGTPAAPVRYTWGGCIAPRQAHRILEAAPIVAVFEITNCDLQSDDRGAATLSVLAEARKVLRSVNRTIAAQPIAARVTAAPARRSVHRAFEARPIVAAVAGADASDHLDRLMQGRTAIAHVLMAPAKEPTPRPYHPALLQGQIRTRFPSE